MPKFHFDTEFDGTLAQDEDGQELPNREAARREAVAALSEMARGLPSGAADQKPIAIIVRDGIGEPVLTAVLALSVEWHE